MMFAPFEARETAKVQMLERTLMWVAAREEKGIPPGPVDFYAKNVVQLLLEQSMELQQRERGPPTEHVLDERTVNEMLWKYAQARQQREQQDKEFHDNPNKEAAMRDMRKGKYVQSGIHRLLHLKPNDEKLRGGLVAKGYNAEDNR